MVVGKAIVIIIVIVVVILILTIIFICPLFFIQRDIEMGGKGKREIKGAIYRERENNI